MQLFEYHGQSSDGRPVQGQLRAGTAQEAEHMLRVRGIRVTQLGSPGSMPSPATQSPAPTAARPQPATKSVVNSGTSGSTRYEYVGYRSFGRVEKGTALANRPEEVIADLVMKGVRIQSLRDARSQVEFIDSKATASQHHLSFFFAQASQMLRAGISPGETFTSLARQTRQPDLARAAEFIGQQAIEGRRISDSMERYPNLFPTHFSGIVRVGEMSGGLPIALEKAAFVAQAAHTIGRMFWWVIVLIVNAALLIPIAMGWSRGMLDAWNSFSTGADAGRPPLTIVLGSLIQNFLTIALPISILVLFLGWLGSKVFLGPRFRMARHRAAAFYPFLKKRSQHESNAILTWALGEVQKAGAAPQTAWMLAANAVPNLVHRNKLVEVLDRSTETSVLSSMANESQILNWEYTSAIATGEKVGNVASMLEQVSQQETHEFYRAEGITRFAASRLGCAWLLITGLVVIIIVYNLWYRTLPDAILKDFEVP